jgi:hypothetical protein
MQGRVLSTGFGCQTGRSGDERLPGNGLKIEWACHALPDCRRRIYSSGPAMACLPSSLSIWSSRNGSNPAWHGDEDRNLPASAGLKNDRSFSVKQRVDDPSKLFSGFGGGICIMHKSLSKGHSGPVAPKFAVGPKNDNQPREPGVQTGRGCRRHSPGHFLTAGSLYPGNRM